jgi:hypothetical protein
MAWKCFTLRVTTSNVEMQCRSTDDEVREVDGDALAHLLAVDASC